MAKVFRYFDELLWVISRPTLSAGSFPQQKIIIKFCENWK